MMKIPTHVLKYHHAVQEYCIDTTQLIINYNKRV